MMVKYCVFVWIDPEPSYGVLHFLTMNDKNLTSQLKPTE